MAVPEYDFATHCRLPTTTAAEPRQVIIVEVGWWMGGWMGGGVVAGR